MIKDKSYKLFLFGAALLILILESGVLISIFLSKDFSVVIFVSILISVIGFLTVAFVWLPLLDGMFSSFTRLIERVKRSRGESVDQLKVDEMSYIEKILSKEFHDDERRNPFSDKFQEVLFKAASTSDLSRITSEGLRTIQCIDGAILLVISEDRTKVELLPLFPEGLTEKREFSLTGNELSHHSVRLQTSVYRPELGRRIDLNEAEKVFVRQEYRCSFTAPMIYEGTFFGLLGVASKEDNALSKETMLLLEGIARAVGLKLAYNRLAYQLRHKDEEVAVAKQAGKEKIEKQIIEIQEGYNTVVQTAKMASLGQLSAGVAHELNNPIGGILGYTQMVLNKLKVSPVSQETISSIIKYLEMVEKESKRCQWIVSNLLNFSRKPSEELMLINLQDVIENTISMMEFQLSDKNIKISTHFPAEGLKKVIGNANQLQQVFTNLLSNSQDAMSAGGEITITGSNKSDIRYKPPLEYIEVNFADSGSGIPKENLAKIFDPFFTSKTERAGTGLGLSITYTIVTYHKGTIKVESEVGKGTTFILNFPVHQEKKP